MAGLSTCIGKDTAPQLSCLGGVVGAVINLAFMFVGGICLLFLLWGAIKFIMSAGDQKAVKGARDTMTYAVIGTMIVLGAYAILSLASGTILPKEISLLKLFP